MQRGWNGWRALLDNRDTEYKRALLDTLSGAFGSATDKHGELGLEREPFVFSAAVVLFDEIDALLPALIRGQPKATGATKSN